MKKKKKVEKHSILNDLNGLLFDTIREITGKNTTDEEIKAYLGTLSPEEAEKLTESILYKMLFDTMGTNKSHKDNEDYEDDTPFPFMYDDNDGDDREYDYESNGCMECMPAMEIKKYTLRIKLRGISPSIWRKIVVPSSIKLTSLAEIILEAMGWWNEHLHQFRVKKTYYATKHMEADEFGWSDTRWGGDYSIAHLLKKERENVVFEYDYGDSWEHDVTLSKIEDFEEDETPYVQLLGGKRACPPEDCGGVPGYYNLCETMKHPYSTYAKEAKEWLGFNFDPEEFDLETAKTTIGAFNNDDFEDDFEDEEDTDN